MALVDNYNNSTAPKDKDRVSDESAETDSSVSTVGLILDPQQTPTSPSDLSSPLENVSRVDCLPSVLKVRVYHGRLSLNVEVTLFPELVKYLFSQWFAYGGKSRAFEGLPIYF